MNLQINKEALSPNTILSAGKWELWPYTFEDVNVIYACGRDPEIAYYMGKEKMPNKRMAADLVNDMIQRLEEKRGIAWVIIDTATNMKAGHLGLWEIDADHCRAELGYALLAPFRQKGVMSELMPVVLDFAFNKLKLHSISANTSVDNEGSRRLLEKYGFQLEAKFRENHLYRGEYIDSLIYCKLETDP